MSVAVADVSLAVSVDDMLTILKPALYVAGEVLKVFDREQRKTGEVKYYARMIIDDEPGMIQVNITDLSPNDIRYLARHERERVLLRVRSFAMEGSVFHKATELVRKADSDSGSALSALLSEGDET